MPIPILQYGVKVRDPTTKEFSDLAALRGGQGPQGQTGPGVPAGGSDGDVLVKNGETDYAARWTNTPPQMGSLANINATSAADRKYAKNEFLVYNGQLYKAAAEISQYETLTPGSNILPTAALSAQYYDDAGINGIHCKTFSGIGVLYGSINQSITLNAYQTTTIGTIVAELRPSVTTGRTVWFARTTGGQAVPVGVIIYNDGTVGAYNIGAQNLQVESISGSSVYLL